APEAPRAVDAPLLVIGAPGGAPRLRALLEEEGFAVLEAATPGDLVRRARRHRPDAVVLDFAAADLREAVRLLRREADTHGLPVLAVVSREHRADALAAADLVLAPDEVERLPS